jgi:hypothetical protein
MVRLLIIVSVASFVLCAACFALVTALGGADIARHGWGAWTWSDRDWDGDREHRRDHRRVSGADWNSPTATRDIAFTGAPELKFDIPADITYTQAPQGRLSITGPRAIIDRIEVEGGEFRLRGYRGWSGHGHERLKIVLSSPDTRSFSVRGSQSLTIQGYQQDELTIEMAGSGSVKAAGAADRASIDIMGSGEVDLGALSLNHAEIDIAGSGDVTIGPKESADIDIAGSGDVTLTTQPPQLTTDIAGSGDIHTAPTVSSPAPATPAPQAPAKPAPSA